VSGRFVTVGNMSIDDLVFADGSTKWAVPGGNAGAGYSSIVISHGAGAEMRHAMGVAVFSGMIGVTLFGIFLTPVFYYVIQWFSDRRAQRVE
jgi:Na+/phosphate symporter